MEFFHCCGSRPEYNDRLKRRCTDGVSSFAHSLRTNVGNPSGPWALCGLSLDSAWNTSFSDSCSRSKRGVQSEESSSVVFEVCFQFDFVKLNTWQIPY